MSTILKALKKAQQERERLEVPKLDARLLPAGPRRALWPWLIGGILLTNAAVLALVFWLYGMPTTATTVAEVAETGEQAAPVSPTASAPEPTRAATPDGDPSTTTTETALAAAESPEEPEPGTEAARTTAPPPSEEAAEARTDSSPPQTEPATGDRQEPATPQWDSAAAARPAEAPAAVEDKAKSAAAGTRAAVTPAALEVPLETPRPPTDGRDEPPAAASTAPADIPPAKPIERLAALATPEQAVVPRTSEPTAAPKRANGTLPKLESEVEVAALPKHAVPDQPPEPSPKAAVDPYSALPVLRQLPRDMRRSLPELAISIHVYDNDPRWRFVRINKTKYREGDRLAKDLTLEAITPGGLVLDFQGTRFLLAKP